MSWLHERPSASLVEATEVVVNWSNQTELCSGAVDLFQQVAPLHAVKLVQKFSFPYFFGPSFHFCVLPNPLLKALRLHAELNLYKIRTCRNIAGDQRQLEPYAASTGTEAGMPIIGAGGRITSPGTIILHPTQYRYETLIERAKQLISLAQQIESAFLSTLEKRDAEYYNLLRARQEMHLTRAGVSLQELRVREAKDGFALAELQRERAQIQVDHYHKLLDEGLIDPERDALNVMGVRSRFLEDLSSVMSEITRGFAEAIPFLGSVFGGARSRKIQRLLTLASFERRRQEWQFLPPPFKAG